MTSGGDTKESSSVPTLNGDMQTRVLPGSEQAFGTTGTVGRQNRRVGREKREKRVHSGMDDICYTMFQVPMETRMNAPPPTQALPIPPRSCSSHSPRTQRHGGRQTRAAGGAQQLCCSSPLLLFDFLPSTSAGQRQCLHYTRTGKHCVCFICI